MVTEDKLLAVLERQTKAFEQGIEDFAGQTDSTD